MDSKSSSGNQFDKKCPKCGKDDHLAVVASMWVRLLPDGTDPGADGLPDYDHEWGEDSTMTCTHCDHSGEAKDFELDENAETPEGICPDLDEISDEDHEDLRRHDALGLND